MVEVNSKIDDVFDIKSINFKNDFDELENDMFAGKYEDIKYFGINEESDSKLYSQVDVLYYNDEGDFAVILNTKEDEQVILARGVKGNTFASMYNDIVNKSNDDIRYQINYTQMILNETEISLKNLINNELNINSNK